MSDLQPDKFGAYINPYQLERIAEASCEPIKELLKRAALEITRERIRIDQLQAQLNAALYG